MRDRLSETDIGALLNAPTEDTRADVAAKVAGVIGLGGLNDREREIANEILGVMVHDAAVRVRKSLAVSLAHVEGIPEDIVTSLARDVDDVAIPIIEGSPVLSDQNLLEIIRGGEEAKQIAIASRNVVSPVVADALVETETRSVVARLVANDGAEIRAQSYGKILEKFGEDSTITDTIACRSYVPVTIAEKLVTLVSDEMRNLLVERHSVSAALADELVRESRERATADLLGDYKQVDDVERLVTQLSRTGRLSASLILRAACQGDMRFVEEAFAQKVGISTDRAWQLIHDGGPLGFKAIYARSGLPEVLFPAFRTAIDVYHEIDYDGLPADRVRFARTMVERVLTQYEGIDGEDLDFLLNRLGQLEQVA